MKRLIEALVCMQHTLRIRKLDERRRKSDFLIKVFAENVNITRPIRLHHFRYPTYIAPRGKNNYLIAAEFG